MPMGLKSLKMMIKSEISMVWPAYIAFSLIWAFGVGKSATGTAYFILELHPNGLDVKNMFFFQEQTLQQSVFQKWVCFCHWRVKNGKGNKMSLSSSLSIIFMCSWSGNGGVGDLETTTIVKDCQSQWVRPGSFSSLQTTSPRGLFRGENPLPYAWDTELSSLIHCRDIKGKSVQTN